MPAWATVAITVGASAVAVAWTLAATWLQLRHARRESERADTARHRERAGEVLGRVRTLLVDLDPDRIAVNVSDETPAWLMRTEQRWESLREELSIFAASQADARVMDAASKLEIAISRTLNWARWLVHDLLRHRDWQEAHRHLTWDRLRALSLTRIILLLVRDQDVADLRVALRTLDTTEALEALLSKVQERGRERVEALKAGGNGEASTAEGE
jgi:hypothetical protein